MCSHYFSQGVLDALRRLAAFANVDAHDLVAEFEAAMREIGVEELPAVLGVDDDLQHVDAVAMWDVFLQRMASRSKAVEFDALVQAILSWRSLRFASTSGVESSFTKMWLRISPRQLSASACYEEALARIVADGPSLSSSSRAKLMLKSQRVWQRCCFGVPRASGSMNRRRRVDYGVAKLAVDDCEGVGVSEAAFVKRRRLSASRLSLASSIALPLPLDALASFDSVERLGELLETSLAATASFQNEVCFAQHKVQKRKLQAIREGLLLDGEIGDGELAEASAAAARVVAAEGARGRARDAARVRNFGAASALDAALLHGARVFVSAECGDDLARLLPATSLRVWDAMDAAFVQMPAPPSKLSPKCVLHY